jgi:LysM repeat protein
MSDDSGNADFSDVHGAAQFTAASKAGFSDVQSQVGSTVDKATIYTVALGDSLSKIASRFYGSSNGCEENL